VEPTPSAIDFFVETMVASVRALQMPSLTSIELTASKKEDLKKEILVAVTVVA
jgi:hypothetical protein